MIHKLFYLLEYFFRYKYNGFWGKKQSILGRSDDGFKNSYSILVSSFYSIKFK